MKKFLLMLGIFLIGGTLTITIFRDNLVVGFILLLGIMLIAGVVIKVK